MFSTVDRIGFAGLGAMGAGIVQRLLDAGYEVVGWNRTEGKAQPLLEAGMGWTDTPRELAGRVDVLGRGGRQGRPGHGRRGRHPAGAGRRAGRRRHHPRLPHPARRRQAPVHHLGGPVTLAPTGVVASPFVTHLQYRIVK
jgi:NAD binding domain of 6-phosphogluconate dehydrogenase